MNVMTPCRRACLTMGLFNQTAKVLRIGIPTLTSTNTTTPATPTVDRFGSSKGKSAYSPVLEPKPGVTDRFQIATYPCRVTTNAKPADQVVADTNQARCEWRVYMPLGADVHPEDRIDVSGRIYDVVDTDAGRADASFLTLFCRSEK